MSDGPFTTEFVKHIRDTFATQQGIIEFIQVAAPIMAEAARASHKATGDSELFALSKWTQILQDRAIELLKGGAVDLIAENRRQIGHSVQ